MRRVLVATDGPCPETALRHAAALAGVDGEVVLAAVVLVPHALPIEAGLEGAVGDACATLDRGERVAAAAAVFDTRLVRARSFADGVLGLLAAEPFDALVLEVGTGRSGSRPQIDALVERADPAVVLVRPARRAGALSP